MSKEFRVTWEIQISADSPEEAARIAQGYQRDTTSISNQFYVQDEETLEIVSVDLDEAPGEETLPVKEYKPLIVNKI